MKSNINKRVVNGINIETEKYQEIDCNIIEVETGTNCPKGGDNGHGGRTYLRIQDISATFIKITQLSNGNGVELELCGDSECSTLIKALEFAVTKLKEQWENNKIDNN